MKNSTNSISKKQTQQKSEFMFAILLPIIITIFNMFFSRDSGRALPRRPPGFLPAAAQALPEQPPDAGQRPLLRWQPRRPQRLLGRLRHQVPPVLKALHGTSRRREQLHVRWTDHAGCPNNRRRRRKRRWPRQRLADHPVWYWLQVAGRLNWLLKDGFYPKIVTQVAHVMFYAWLVTFLVQIFLSKCLVLLKMNQPVFFGCKHGGVAIWLAAFRCLRRSTCGFSMLWLGEHKRFILWLTLAVNDNSYNNNNDIM